MQAGMINRNTVKVLDLEPITRTKCHAFDIKINSEFNTPESIKEAVSWWQKDMKN